MTEGKCVWGTGNGSGKIRIWAKMEMDVVNIRICFKNTSTYVVLNYEGYWDMVMDISLSE
jgi:hypothetical protein